MDERLKVRLLCAAFNTLFRGFADSQVKKAIGSRFANTYRKNESI